jgi:hypothetical protein
MLGLKLGRFMLLAVVVAAATPQPSHAQLGGLAKKKAAAKAQKAVMTEEPAAEDVPDNFHTEGVLVISEPVLVALEKGLNVEIALREELMKEMARMKTPEQFDQCQNATLLSPEGLKVIGPLNANEGGTQEARLAVIAKVGAESEALTLKMCGKDPHKFNPGWRASQLASFRVKGAEAAGPIEDPQFDGGAAPAAQGESDAADLPVATTPVIRDVWYTGMTLEEYLILQERVIAFCIYLKTRGGSLSLLIPDKGNLSIPGVNDKGTFKYTQREMRALIPHCSSLTKLITQALN